MKYVTHSLRKLLLKILSQWQRCFKRGKTFSKTLLLLQHNTKDEIFLSSVKEDKPASGINKTQEVFNLIVCSYLHLGYFSLSFSFESYILSTFYRAIWDKHIECDIHKAVESKLHAIKRVAIKTDTQPGGQQPTLWPIGQCVCSLTFWWSIITYQVEATAVESFMYK